MARRSHSKFSIPDATIRFVAGIPVYSGQPALFVASRDHKFLVPERIASLHALDASTLAAQLNSCAVFLRARIGLGATRRSFRSSSRQKVSQWATIMKYRAMVIVFAER